MGNTGHHMKKIAVIYSIAFFFLVPFTAPAGTETNPMSAVQENMQRMEQYRTGNTLHQHSEKTAENSPYATQQNDVTHSSTTLQDKAKLIELLNRVTLNDEEKKELITLIRNK